MSELFDSEFLKKVKQLALSTKIITASGSVGNRKSRSKGSSVEFSDFREYTPGDDFRRIDWNAYGRFEKLFIKLFLEEREAAVHIYLDTSKSMDWGEPNKSIMSRRLAAVLSYISLSSYDCVSISSISDTCEKSILSLRGKNSFGNVLNFLQDLIYKSKTDLYKAIEASQWKQSKGISVIISDLQPQDGLLETIRLLQFRKQEVHICHILSPQEISPSVNSSLRLIDSEIGNAKDVTIYQQLLKEYRKVYLSYVREVEETCLKLGANYVHMDSGMAIEKMVRLVVEG